MPPHTIHGLTSYPFLSFLSYFLPSLINLYLTLTTIFFTSASPFSFFTSLLPYALLSFSYPPLSFLIFFASSHHLLPLFLFPLSSFSPSFLLPPLICLYLTPLSFLHSTSSSLTTSFSFLLHWGLYFPFLASSHYLLSSSLPLFHPISRSLFQQSLTTFCLNFAHHFYFFTSCNCSIYHSPHLPSPSLILSFLEEVWCLRLSPPSLTVSTLFHFPPSVHPSLFSSPLHII